MKIEPFADLTSLNTFRFNATCASLITVEGAADIDHLPAFRRDDLPLIIGSGSNLLLLNTEKTTCLHMATTGWLIDDENTSTVDLWVEAGHNWHQLVMETTVKGWWGLENLALIPGTVGAAPVQNIGAYGVEVGALIQEMAVYDLATQAQFSLNAKEADFGYRDSCFKRPEQASWLITAVKFRLSKAANPVLDYGPLKALQNQPELSALQVAQTVTAIRREKLPDINEVGSAGSFFKNPWVTQEQLDAIKASYPDVVYYPMAHSELQAKGQLPPMYKLAAGWLIDQLGFKGERRGMIGVYPKQALVLAHYFKEGQGLARELDTLADDIALAVKEHFAVSLEREVRRVE
ncbi:MAG: UDP-N-acetylmuramate dehydrogenase [Pseudomonadota bacterium]|nr:UDP-N-acetylmuramate dehydrogenase [Pseudomonadota bacterium]